VAPKQLDPKNGMKLFKTYHLYTQNKKMIVDLKWKTVNERSRSTTL